MDINLPASSLARVPGPPRTLKGKAGQEVTTNAIAKATNIYTRNAMDAVLYEHGEDLTKKLVEKALAGDIAAIKICMDKVVPNATHRQSPIALPSIYSSEQAVDALRTIVDGAASGEIALDCAQVMTNLVSNLRESIKQETEVAQWKESVEHLHNKLKGVTAQND